jgi:hypothetical protein
MGLNIPFTHGEENPSRLLMTKAATAGAPTSLWNLFWDRDIARKEPTAVASWKNTLTREAEIHAVIQFFFHSQWLKLKRYANERGIKIIGDIPIFVAQDSADLWSRRDLFQVDAEGNPLFVAGVPPDYFSSTGQLESSLRLGRVRQGEIRLVDREGAEGIEFRGHPSNRPFQGFRCLLAGQGGGQNGGEREVGEDPRGGTLYCA